MTGKARRESFLSLAAEKLAVYQFIRSSSPLRELHRVDVEWLFQATNQQGL